jgi:two-component system sensor histidine kinase UhpB
MPAALRMLHIEDRQDDADLIRLDLEAAGYEIGCLRVETAAEMKEALIAQNWDVIICDYNLPAFDAIRALGILRESGKDIPFIIVSSYIGEEAAVALMKAGAHDYVMKDHLARLAPAIEREVKEAEERRLRRQAEETSKQHEKLLRDITSAVGEGLLVQNMAGRLLFMNPEAERLLGWSEHELVALDVHESIHYLRSDGSPLPREQCSILNLVRQGRPYHNRDDVFVRKDGTVFPVAYVSTPIIDNGQIFAIVIAFHDITELKQAEQELQQSRQQLRELSVFLQTVREEERKRIARELHDELGQTLTALRIDLNWLEERLPGAEPRITDKLAAMESLLNKTVDSMRRISEDLRPGMLDDLGLAAAIEHHVEKFTEQTGIPCELTMRQDDFDLDEQIATAVFRILQESLTNVTRHAAASRVSIEVQESGDEIRLTVQDDGCGLPDKKDRRRNSYGLLGMHERVKMLGGYLEISSAPGKGTRIEAVIPVAMEIIKR